METKHNFIIPELTGKHKYRVVLRLDGYRPGISGAFGGSIPRISTRKFCICCDKPTNYKVEVDPFTDDNRVLSKPMFVHTCTACEGHSLDLDWQVKLAATMILVGAGLGLMMIAGIGKNGIENTPVLAIVGLIAAILLVAGGIFISKDSSKRSAYKDKKHHSRTKIVTVRDKELIFESSNLRVIEELLEDHADAVAYITTTAEKYKTRRK